MPVKNFQVYFTLNKVTVLEIKMQANMIKHQTLEIDGKIAGIILSEKEFQRVLKIIKSVTLVKSKSLNEKKKLTISSTQLNEWKQKNKNGKFIPLKEMKKRIGFLPN